MLVGAGAVRSERPGPVPRRAGRRRGLIAAVVVLAVAATYVQAVPRLLAGEGPEVSGSGLHAPPQAAGNPLPDGVQAPVWAPRPGTAWDVEQPTAPAGDGQGGQAGAGQAQQAGDRHARHEAEREQLGPVSARVDVTDQRGDGEFVVVDQVQVTGTSAWLVVRADAGGRPGPVLGHVAVEPGEAGDVAVPLETPLADSGPLWIDLHRDTEPARVFAFPRGDPPLRAAGPSPLSRLVYEVTS